MRNNGNTDNLSEHPTLDAEDWEIALQPYQGNPYEAVMLGSHLMVLKSYLASKPRKIQDTIEGLDLAMEILFLHTEFHEASYVLFRKLADGKLTRDEEKILEALGITH